MPQRVLRQDFRVSEDDTAKLSSGQSHVQTARIRQEPDALVVIGTDAGKNDVVLLSTLESVHRGDFDLLVRLLLERAGLLTPGSAS